MLGSQLVASRELIERFEREARVIASLNHPHICVLHDVGEHEGTNYLVMEHLEGETLAERLSHGPLSVDQALQYSTQIADALDKAHRQGVVHRDLKPQNIMLTKSGAKLLDFGLAKLKTGRSEAGVLTELPTQSPTLTAEGTILGTFQYMAPEQLEGIEADARTDIFAFGAVLYEMVTGQKAFQGKSHASLIGAILERQPQPISELQPGIPVALDYLIRTCLAKRPEDRRQTAREVLNDLEWIAQARSQALFGTVQGQAPARRILPWAMAALAVLTSIAVVFFALPSSPETTDPLEITFSIQPPDRSEFFEPVLSPDGKILVVTTRREGRNFLSYRFLKATDWPEIPASEQSAVSPSGLRTASRSRLFPAASCTLFPPTAELFASFAGSAALTAARAPAGPGEKGAYFWSLRMGGSGRMPSTPLPRAAEMRRQSRF